MDESETHAEPNEARPADPAEAPTLPSEEEPTTTPDESEAGAPLAASASDAPTTEHVANSWIEKPHPALAAAWNAFSNFASRGPVRLCFVGLVLLILGLRSHSVWAVPALVVGLVMIVVAWAGSRLSGRVELTWGDAGFQVEMRAAVRPVRHLPVAHERTEVLPAPIPLNPRPLPAPRPKVEIDADELNALIAAAERASNR